MAGGTTFTWRHALTLHSTLSPFDSPLPQTHRAFNDVQPVSWKRLNVAGILVTVYGLDELDEGTRQVTALWLLHGRGDTQDSMGYVAAAFLRAWKRRRGPGMRNLICVCFDQRNHGSRLVDSHANVSWGQGNATHGPDMFALYTGTAGDLSHLLTHLPLYLPYSLDEHIACGVSLGGHATWSLLVTEPRITAGIVVIGCPDYTRLMVDRAVRSRLPSTQSSDPPGRDFLGSKDFPGPLLEAIRARDPAGILLDRLDQTTAGGGLDRHSSAEPERARPAIEQALKGKKILSLSGGKDRLVPYAAAVPFLNWLKRAVDRSGGWCNDLEIEVEDKVDPDAGHEFSLMMRKESESWLCQLLAGKAALSPVGRSTL